MYPVPKAVYESPVQGITGLWGGVGGALVSGESGDDFWQHIRFVATTVPASNTQSGPSLTNIRDGLSSPVGNDMTWKTDTADLNSNGGIILLRIPADDNYKITIRGADGAPAHVTFTQGPGSCIGAGAEVYGTFSLTENTVLGMLLGMTPPGTTQPSGSAGGGGSFVYSTPSMTSSQGFGSNTLWVAAGGGGGWGHGPPSAQGGQAPYNSISGVDGTGTGSGGGPNGQGTHNSGGGGRGGGPPTDHSNSGGGSGWQGAGGNSTSGTQGGLWSTTGQLTGGQGGSQIGGWGGGGGATGNGVAGGGGGGYSGGSGGNGFNGSVWGGGGGGGSYTNPQSSSSGGNANSRVGQGQTPQHGFIQIERV